MTGTPRYLGKDILPQACLAALTLHQRLGKLMVRHAKDVVLVPRELNTYIAVFYFCLPQSIKSITICTHLDALHSSQCESYGQTGGVSGPGRTTRNEQYHYRPLS